MKKIKFIILTITVALISFSCDNDGGTSLRNFEGGIIANMQKDASTDAFLDLVKVASGENISISFNADIALGEPTSTNIVGVYKAASGAVYNSVLFTNPTLPENFTLSINDIIAAFSELSTTDDIKLGDVLSLTASFIRSDGRVLNTLNPDGTDNFSNNVKNSVLYTAVIDYPVSCPSDIAGTYLVSSTSTGACCGVPPITDYEYIVTVTANGGGAYQLSDYSGGAFDGLFCAAFAICGDTSSGEITDVCGAVGGSAADCCGSEYEFNGVVNEDGSWTVEVASGFMAATSTWTKQ